MVPLRLVAAVLLYIVSELDPDPAVAFKVIFKVVLVPPISDNIIVDVELIKVLVQVMA